MEKESDHHIKDRKKELPNCISSLEDIYSIKVSRYRFYPEDLEKMKKMTPLQARKYRAQLVREGKTYD